MNLEPFCEFIQINVVLRLREHILTIAGDLHIQSGLRVEVAVLHVEFEVELLVVRRLIDLIRVLIKAGHSVVE